jgi:glutamyl-Q tRNA(Asp) synthetase
MTYRGRFAPSPTGPLHLGSLVAALASWLDARAHGGSWLVRIEDLDPPREQAGAAQRQLDALQRLGLVPDEPVLRQSSRVSHYAAALQRLVSLGQIYPCSCSRLRVEAAARQAGLPPHVYAGCCRAGPAGTGPMSQRLRVPPGPVVFEDRACGRISQDVVGEVGDFVVRRADELWSYQLAVVVDDADQGITDVVRGADLLDNTPRQIVLQRLLGLPTPRYLHVPVVLAHDGTKLSKQTGARPLALDHPLQPLSQAWRHLGFEPIVATDVGAFLRQAVPLWAQRWSRAAACTAGAGGPGRPGRPGQADAADTILA